MNLTRLFSIRGRTGRAEYFLQSFSGSVIVFIFGLANIREGNPVAPTGFLDQLNQFLFNIATTAASVAWVCATIRRFHDMGRSGFHFFGIFLPLYNLYLFLLLFLQEGQRTTNKYGPPTRLVFKRKLRKPRIKPEPETNPFTVD